MKNVSILASVAPKRSVCILLVVSYKASGLGVTLLNCVGVGRVKGLPSMACFLALGTNPTREGCHLVLPPSGSIGLPLLQDCRAFLNKTQSVHP